MSRRWQYGTKRYGYKAALRWMRDYAKTQRVYRNDTSKRTAHEENRAAHRGALGAVSALYETGALTLRQYDRMFARIYRINSAKVTRSRPFVSKATARPAGPVVCSFADELAGKAPPTFGRAAERRSS